MEWINCSQELPPTNQEVFIKFKDSKHIGGVFNSWYDKYKNDKLTIRGHLYSNYSENLSDFYWLKE